MVTAQLSSGLDVLMARRRAGLKQWQLAARLGFSPTIVCDIERGRRPVTPALADRIAEALREGIAEVLR
jgi:transcriptional regulator with XRE-family HTH domain